jgi:CRP/FNR family transcriptional regulator, cyclic AMP receptor protein
MKLVNLPFLDTIGAGRSIRKYRHGEEVYLQGKPANSLFYVRHGMVQLTIGSKQGQKAVIGLPGAGEFFGEACLAGQVRFTASATATVEGTSLVEIEKAVMLQALREDPDLSGQFMAFLLSRHVQLESDLADHMFKAGDDNPPPRLRDYIRVVPD